MRNFLTTLIPATVLLGACVSSDDTAPTSSVDQDMTGDNGISINGISINGISINGISINGISINGISINGISINGISINGISINGISINGISINGNAFSAPAAGGGVLTGTDFVGATIGASLSDGTAATLRIDSATTLGGANDDVWAYGISLQTDQGWARLCGDETDGSAKLAIPVQGTWNPTTGAWSDNGSQFSLACRKASVAKCVEFGYKPWDGFDNEHRACVRMLRADYCGDGTPHTVNGTVINLYDNLGIQADTESWPVDAEWTPDGARCINHYRGGTAPSCYAAKYSATCGSFASGANLIDEYNGQ
jgi:hypothetical protein